MATWINFKELREKIRIGEVLKRYDVQLRVRGEKATCFCPLPTHPTRGDGKKRTASFSVHLGRGIWNCFGCGAKGNVLELGARLLGFDPDDPTQFRKAALKLAETFDIECERPKGRVGDDTPARQVDEPQQQPPVESQAAETSAPSIAPARVLVNQPIDFELKNLVPDHPYLLKRGFTTATINHFGLGFCSRGLMKDRIAIPIHDPDGRLVGYAGRLIDDSKIGDEHPKYLLPGRRERDGVTHEFRKSLLAYNLHRLGGEVDDLIVVEGFASVWWLWQHGYSNVVALMGSSCSDEQAGLIAGHVVSNTHVVREGHVWLMADGNGGGEQLISQALRRLASHSFTRLVQLAERQQPTDLTANDLGRLLTFASAFNLSNDEAMDVSP